MYKPRHADELIQRRLNSIGAVVLEGARGTGKTRTGRYHAKSFVYVDRELDRLPMLADVAEQLIQGDVPRLVDEWQVLPKLWNVIRREVDERDTHGQFILTGSAVPQDSVTRHTGVGRFSRIRMRPMSLSEMYGVPTSFRFVDLLDSTLEAGGISELQLDDLIAVMLAGGWPGNYTGTMDSRIQWVRDYFDELTRVELAQFEVTQRRRDPQKIARVLRSIARNVGSPANEATLMRDVAEINESASRNTVSAYTEVLRRVMILEEVPSWRPHLRSRATLRTAPKRYFVDPSLAAAALQAGFNELRTDLEFTGLLFENLVLRDLLTLAQNHGASVSFYRDSNGLEVDAIIEAPSGEWFAVEIKLGQSSVDRAASNLLKLADRIDLNMMQPPSSLVVITGWGVSHTRADGVHVIPYSCLGL